MARSFEDSLTDVQIDLLAKAQGNPDSLSDAEVDEMARLQDRFDAYQRPELSNTEAAKTIGMGALNLAGRALDLPGGVVRTGVAQVIDPFVDADLISGEDWKNAAVGNALSTDKILERGGVGELGSVELPPSFGGKYTGRGALGFTGDVASGFGASAGLKTAAKGTGMLAKAASALRAPEALVEKGVQSAGKKLYRSGVKALDIVGDKFGKGRYGVSDTLMKYGVRGSPSTIKTQVEKIAERLAAEQKEILADAGAKGATVDFDQVLRPVSRDAAKISKGLNIIPVREQAGAAKTMIDDLIERGGYVPEQTISGEAVQAPLFGQSEHAIPVERNVKTFIADQPIAQTNIPAEQTSMFPKGQSAQTTTPNVSQEELFMLLQNKGKYPVKHLTKEAAWNEVAGKGVYVDPITGQLVGAVPEQITVSSGQFGGKVVGDELFDTELLNSRKYSDPIMQTEKEVFGVLPKGQTPLFTPMEGMPGPKPTFIPGQKAAGVQDASKIKTQIYNQLGDASFNSLSKDKAGSKLFKRAANRLKIAVEQSVDRVNPGQGAKLRQTNADLGNFLTPLKKVNSEAAKDIMKNSITQIDATLAGLALSNPATIPVLFGKGVGKIITAPGARTKAGYQMATNPNVARAATQGIVEAAPGERGDAGDISDTITMEIERIRRKMRDKGNTK